MSDFYFISADDILEKQTHDLKQKELISLMNYLLRNLYLKNFWIINNLMRDLDANKASDIILVSMLRLTSKYKSQLPHYTILLKKYITVLKSRNENPHNKLHGLMEKI